MLIWNEKSACCLIQSQDHWNIYLSPVDTDCLWLFKVLGKSFSVPNCVVFEIHACKHLSLQSFCWVSASVLQDLLFCIESCWLVFGYILEEKGAKICHCLMMHSYSQRHCTEFCTVFNVRLAMHTIFSYLEFIKASDSCSLCQVLWSAQVLVYHCCWFAWYPGQKGAFFSGMFPSLFASSWNIISWAQETTGGSSP